MASLFASLPVLNSPSPSAFLHFLLFFAFFFFFFWFLITQLLRYQSEKHKASAISSLSLNSRSAFTKKPTKLTKLGRLFVFSLRKAKIPGIWSDGWLLAEKKKNSTQTGPRQQLMGWNNPYKQPEKNRTKLGCNWALPPYFWRGPLWIATFFLQIFGLTPWRCRTCSTRQALRQFLGRSSNTRHLDQMGCQWKPLRYDELTPCSGTM